MKTTRNRLKIIIPMLLLCLVYACQLPETTDPPAEPPFVTPTLTFADRLKLKADSLYSGKAYEQSYVYYGKADSSYRLQGDLDRAYGVQIDQAMVQYRTDWEKALHQLESILEAALGELHRDSWALAKAYHKTGVIISNKKKDKQLAIEFYKKALKIREQRSDIEGRELVLGCKNIGEGYFQLSQKDSSDLYYRKAIKYILQFEQEIDNKLKAQCYHGIANLLHTNDDLHQAKDHFALAVQYYQMDSVSQPWHKAPVYSEYAVVLKDLRMYQEALTYARLAISEINSIENKQGSDLANLANFHNNCGLVYKDMKQYKKAQEQYFKAIELNKSLKGRDHFLADNYNNLSIALKYQGRWAEAVDALNEAIGLNFTADRRIELAKNYDNQGDLYLARHQYSAALKAYETAVQLLWSGKNTGEPYLSWSLDQLVEIPNKTEIVVPLSSALKTNLILSERGNVSSLQKAYHQILTLETLLDLIRQHYSMDDSKASLAEKAKSIYDNAITVSLRLYESTKESVYFQKAFDLAEKSKSVILLEALRHSKAKQFNIPEDLLDQERELKAAINNYEKQIFQFEGDSSQLHLIRDRLLKSRYQLDNLIQTFERKFPKYYRLKYDLKIPSIAELQNQLQADQALLTYFMGPSNLYSFLITRSRFSYASVGSRDQLTGRITDLRKGLLGRFQPVQQLEVKPADSLYYTNAALLYEQLLATARIPGSIRRLHIIPDELLGYVPFEALLTRRPAAGADFHQLPYLKNHYVISYNYSATVFAEQQLATDQAKKHGILAFAPTQSGPVPVPTGGPENAVTYLSRINVKPEVRQLQKLYKGKFLYEQKANIANFKKYCDQYSIVHFPGHGKVNDQNPEYSFLLFTPDQQQDQNPEGFFYVRDFYDLELSADLMVFTACETADGMLYRGEGIISLARAAFYAGSKSLITTLWPLQTQEKGALIGLFYQNLSKGLPKDEALHLAKDQFLKGKVGITAHPYHWAGYIAMGHMATIKVPKSFSVLAYF